MAALVLGLVIFLGVHSVRIVADDWRTRTRQRIGANAWRGAYSLASLAGFALIVWGYASARAEPVPLWSPPAGAPHLAALLTVVAFVLVSAAYVPNNGLKARLHHPMVIGVALWAIAHLIANGTLADLLLFGGLLIWSLASGYAARARDRDARTVYGTGSGARTALTVAVGVAGWAVFAFWGHEALIGVRPI